MPVSHPLGGLKIQLFQNTVMLHIKLKGITNAAAWLQKFCPQTPTHPLTLGLGSIGQNSTFSEHGHVAYQIKSNHEMQQYGCKYFARRSPLTLGVKSPTFSEEWHGKCCDKGYQVSKGSSPMEIFIVMLIKVWVVYIQMSRG